MINKKLLRKITTLILATALVFVGANFFGSTKISTVRAFGDLVVNFHVSAGDPIFVVNNMAPGDPPEIRDVDVTNNSTTARFVAVKGVRTGGVGNDPKLETILDIVISEDGTELYGGANPANAKTVKDFFDDSGDPNGIKLSVVNPSETTTYNFKVTFPTFAGNDFQGKSVIFDLTFGVITAQNLVINEVYYKVDSAHGLDSFKDRGAVCGGCEAKNIGNGSGSKNTAICLNINSTTVVQENSANIQNKTSASANTGGNQATGNNGGNTNINTGKASSSISVSNEANKNVASLTCGGGKGQNDEWVEIYNPTNQDISLKNWTLTDNSGQETIIHANKKVAAGGFVLLSKDADTWKFWNENSAAVKIELGRQIGDGLDNSGDHLFLKNPAGDIIDEVGWGSDTAVWNPAVPLVSLGSSIERLVPGFDTNSASDWKKQATPTPGN